MINWDAVGAIGEILGALAVLLTLIYLARQIKINAASLDRANEHAQASSIHESSTLYFNVMAQLAQDHKLASIYHRALEGEDLDDVETIRFVAFVNTYFTWLEELVGQASANLGYFDFAQTEVKEMTRGLFPYWGQLLATTAGNEWWSELAPHQFTPTFVAIVNEIVDEGQEALPLRA